MNPEPQVDKGKVSLASFGHLGQHRQSTQAASTVDRIEVGIDSRQAIVQKIHNGAADQLPLAAKLKETGRADAIAEKIHVLLMAGGKHIAIFVALADIALIEWVVLGAVHLGAQLHINIGIVPQAAALLTIGHKVGNRDAGRDTGGAAMTAGLVVIAATAAKAHAVELAVELGPDMAGWIDKSRGGVAVGKIAAAMGLSEEETNFFQVRGEIAGHGRML